MASYQTLFAAFQGGYSSGEILNKLPDHHRMREEAKTGGSFYEVFEKAIRPYVTPTSRVLEIGCGSGSWTRALLALTPQGEVHTIDIQDPTRFMDPAVWQNRLHCYQITKNDYGFLKDDYFDFFFSFGTMCHLSRAVRRKILSQALTKVRKGGYAVHQYGDWQKLERLPDQAELYKVARSTTEAESVWPENSALNMASEATEAGWVVETPDLNLLKRDGIIVLRRD